MRELVDIFKDKHKGLFLLVEWQSILEEIHFCIVNDIKLTDTQCRILEVIDEYDFLFNFDN